MGSRIWDLGMMVTFFLFLIPLSSSRLAFLDENDEMSYDYGEDDSIEDFKPDDHAGPRSLLDLDRSDTPDWLEADEVVGKKLDVENSQWTEEQTEMYSRGLRDNSTIVTFSVKVYYTIEVGRIAGARIKDMVNLLIFKMNRHFDEVSALAKAELHCLEQMTWSEKEILTWSGRFGNEKIRVNLGENYKHGDKNSADIAIYIVSRLANGANGAAGGGQGLRSDYETFGNGLRNYIAMNSLNGDIVAAHELSHNLGNKHPEEEPDKKENYMKRQIELMRRFRFAIAAVGDEQEQCPRQEAAQEFRSECFKNFGEYFGDELENEIRRPKKSAKACQARCQATDGCSFFSFKEATELPEDNGCTLHGSGAEDIGDQEPNTFITGPAFCPEFTVEPTECRGKCSCDPLLPCGLNEGSCHGDKFCKSGLRCGKNNCKGDFFKEDDNCCTDVCDGKKDCCTEESPCGLGKGDCDKDADCLGDLVCGKNNCDGPSYGQGDDCCTSI